MKRNFLWAVFALAVGCFIVAQSNLLFAKGDVREEDEAEGSIVVPSDEAILLSMAKVDLVDAVKAALRNTPGKAVSAELEEDDGFLVYSVDVVNDGKVTEVKVDAGNKKILKTEVQDEKKCEGGEDEKYGYGEYGKSRKGGDREEE